MRDCPTGCGRKVRAGHAMCGACWARVPADLRSEVWRAWKAWRRDLGDADLMHAHTAAVDAASAAVIARRTV